MLARVALFLLTIILLAFNVEASVKDLENLRIGHVHDVQHSLDIVQGLTNIHTVSESKNHFTMLIADRFDAIITTSIDGELMRERLNLLND